jgi:hypothetical protein
MLWQLLQNPGRALYSMNPTVVTANRMTAKMPTGIKIRITRERRLRPGGTPVMPGQLRA